LRVPEAGHHIIWATKYASWALEKHELALDLFQKTMKKQQMQQTHYSDTDVVEATREIVDQICLASHVLHHKHHGVHQPPLPSLTAKASALRTLASKPEAYQQSCKHPQPLFDMQTCAPPDKKLL
jgi:hypothetical protein